MPSSCGSAQDLTAELFSKLATDSPRQRLHVMSILTEEARASAYVSSRSLTGVQSPDVVSQGEAVLSKTSAVPAATRPVRDDGSARSGQDIAPASDGPEAGMHAPEAHPSDEACARRIGGRPTASPPDAYYPAGCSTVTAAPVESPAASQGTSCGSASVSAALSALP